MRPVQVRQEIQWPLVREPSIIPIRRLLPFRTSLILSIWFILKILEIFNSLWLRLDKGMESSHQENYTKRYIKR